MKFRLLIIALAICVIATPAMAVFYTLDSSDALSLTVIDAYSGASTYAAGLDSLSPYTDPALYNPPPPGFMQGAVGFVGQLDPDLKGDVFGWMELGLGSSAPSSLVGYDSYDLFVANDNDDYWGAMLYVSTSDGSNTTTYYSSGSTSISGYSDFTEIGNHTFALLSLDLSAVNDLDNVVDIGFVVGGSHISSIKGDYPSLGDSFHMSIVPVPAAVILGMLGLSVAGIKLRKYA